MNIKLNIADLNIVIKNNIADRIPDNFLPFISDFEEEKADIVYQFCDAGERKDRTGKSVIKYKRNEIYMNEDTYIKKSILMNDDRTEYEYFTEFAWGKKDVTIYIPLKRVSQRSMNIYFNNFLMFDCVMGWNNRITMHASIVEYKGEAILFTGPSGIGKSTQSDLWKKYFQADIINGDRAVIRADGDVVIAYGSPYAGSSGIYRNKGCPVKAIVFLSQEHENKIRKLSIIEAYKAIFPRFSMVRWDKTTTDAFMSVIMNIIHNVGVYHLGCRPDREAAELACREILG